MIKLNKKIKTELINNIIAKKYEKKYEKALDNVSKKIRKVMVKNSFHSEFKALNLRTEILSVVQAASAININYIDSDSVNFIKFKRSILLSDPVYGYFGPNQIPRDYLPLIEVRDLIKEIEQEHVKLSDVVMSYTTTKKLIGDLPWIKKYLPVEKVNTTNMIPADKLKEIGESFGSL